MNSEQFDELLRTRVSKIGYSLTAKAEEYATDSDRLHNFKKAAVLTGGTPEEALWGMLVKHIISVSDIIEGGNTPSLVLVDEKVGDCINYFILLEAIWTEKIEVITAKALHPVFNQQTFVDKMNDDITKTLVLDTLEKISAADVAFKRSTRISPDITGLLEQSGL